MEQFAANNAACGATFGSGWTGLVRRGQTKVQSLLETVGATIEERIGGESNPAVGGIVAELARWRANTSGGPRSRLSARTPGANGLPNGSAAGRTDRQRSGRVDLPTVAVPLQADRAIWECARG